MSRFKTDAGTIIQDPPLAKFLFSDTRAAWFWLIVRVLLGWDWFSHGLQKFSNPAWMETGEALQGYLTNAVEKTPYDWYASFIGGILDSGAYTWFAKCVVFGEILVGIGLIVGAFVGIAAFFGAFMNWNFIMAGSASTNGFLLAVAILLVLAWKVAGYYGADRILLAKLGTPWRGKEDKANIPLKSSKANAT